MTEVELVGKTDCKSVCIFARGEQTFYYEGPRIELDLGLRHIRLL